MNELASNEPDWDARTLAEAEVIKKDAARLSKAQVAAKELSEKAAADALAMKKVAGFNSTNPPSKPGLTQMPIPGERRKVR